MFPGRNYFLAAAGDAITNRPCHGKFGNSETLLRVRDMPDSGRATTSDPGMFFIWDGQVNNPVSIERPFIGDRLISRNADHRFTGSPGKRRGFLISNHP